MIDVGVSSDKLFLLDLNSLVLALKMYLVKCVFWAFLARSKQSGSGIENVFSEMRFLGAAFSASNFGDEDCMRLG